MRSRNQETGSSRIRQLRMQKVATPARGGKHRKVLQRQARKLEDSKDRTLDMISVPKGYFDALENTFLTLQKVIPYVTMVEGGNERLGRLHSNMLQVSMALGKSEHKLKKISSVYVQNFAEDEDTDEEDDESV